MSSNNNNNNASKIVLTKPPETIIQHIDELTLDLKALMHCLEMYQVQQVHIAASLGKCTFSKKYRKHLKKVNKTIMSLYKQTKKETIFLEALINKASMFPELTITARRTALEKYYKNSKESE